MSRGMPPRAVGTISAERGQRTGDSCVPFLLMVTTVSGTSTYNLFSGDCPRGLRVLDFWCYASGAGGAADTVALQKGTTAITNSLDLNVADNTRVAATTLDDAQMNIEKGGSLRIVTASDATARAFVLCAWRD